MREVLEVLSVFAVSMVKFPFSQAMATGFGFGFLSTYVITALGGCTGVLVFYRTSGWIMERIQHRKFSRLAAGKPAKRSFTRTNRRIVSVKRTQGLGGLAVITPVLISIPVGSILAAKYFRHDPRTVPVLLASVLVWGLVLTSFWRYFE